MQAFDTDSGSTQVSVVRYSGIHTFGIHHEIYFNNYTKSEDIERHIKRMKYSAGYTATGE